MPFLEERLPACFSYGSEFGARYSAEIVVDASGATYASLRHPYPIARYDLGFDNRDHATMVGQLLDLYHRVGGMTGGFRLHDRADYSTNNYRDTPTVGDQPLEEIDAAAGTYQLMRWYGSPANPDATRRRIRKPVAGTVVVGLRDASGATYPTAFSVSTTTGIVTLSTASVQRNITSISQAAQAVVGVAGSGFGFVVGETIVFSGVGGMTQINGKRATVVAVGGSAVTVDIDSTGFSAFTSGGEINTRPQVGEAVTAGCEFDIPVRFESDLSGITFSNLNVLSTSISLVELLNPDPQ